MSFTFVDLFAGCGGLSLGLIQSGGTGLLAIEKNPDAFNTLHTNLGAPAGPLAGFEWMSGIPAEPLGIKEVLTGFMPQLKRVSAGVDVVAGGPPCQGFSVYGRRNRDDGRNRLYLDYLEVVNALRPTVVLLENVTGIDMPFAVDGENTGRYCRDTVAHRIVQRLQALGYQTGIFSLCASQFGVPQYRRRLFVLAVKARRNIADLLAPEYVETLRQAYVQSLGLSPGQTVSVGEAISDLEVTSRQLVSCIDVPNRLQIRYLAPLTPYQREMHADLPDSHAPTSMRLAKHSQLVEDKFRLIQRSGTPGKRVDAAMRERLMSSKHRTHLLDRDRPSVTVTTLPDDFVHYSEPRILTVRELARLQSFPDWFGFAGPYTSGGDRRAYQCPRYTQVGNAVPVRMGRFMGAYVADILRNIKAVEGIRLAA